MSKDLWNRNLYSARMASSFGVERRHHEGGDSRVKREPCQTCISHAMVVEPAKEIESALKSECIMSIISAGSCSSSELPQALAAAVSFQDRKCWGVCAVRRPPRLARLYYLVNDTVTIGSAPFADVNLPHLSPIHAVIRRNISDGSLGLANSSAPSSPPIVAECNGFRVTVSPVETIGFPSSGSLHIPACPPSASPPEEDFMLEIYAVSKNEPAVPSVPAADSAQVDARVFANICDPNIRLKDMLTCQVCHELLFDAVTVSPCCHHFCAPCLSQWLDSDNANAHSCPVCRVILSAATPDPLIRSISAAYAQVEPAHARAPDEIRQLQQVNTGSIARVGERRRHAGEDEDESDDENVSSDESMASWDGHGGGLETSGMIRGPDAFALDIHAPFRPPTFGGEDGNRPMRRTLHRWSELFSVDVDALDQLEEISVNSYLSDVWMAYIASFIACGISDKLQYIHLPDCGLGSAAAPLLGEALCLHFDNVARSHRAGPDENGQDEGDVRGVRELYVDSNFLRDNGCLALLSSPLRHPACTLRAISISSVGLRDVGFATLAASLAFNSTVTELNIRHNPLGDDSIQLLCDIMRGERCSLSCLELGSNAFGSRGLAALGKTLEFTTSLQTLAISSVCSDGEGADCSCWEAWAAGLRVNRTLRHIILHSCSISAVACLVLCVGLEENSTLTRLVLDYNSIGDEGCAGLSRIMYVAAMRRVPDRNYAISEPQLWGLQEVSVVANGIGEKGGAILLRSLVAGGCKLLLDGIGWVIATEVESLESDDPNFTELRAADSILSMALEHVAASIGQQRAAIGEALPSLPELSYCPNLSAAAFATAISSHVPPVYAPYVSLLAFVVPRSSGDLDTESLRQELFQKLPEFVFDCDSATVRASLQRDIALYEKFVEQFNALVAHGDIEAVQALIQQSGSSSLDNCVQRISSALVRLGVPISEKVFYGLPLSVTFCKNGSPKSISYFKQNSFDHPDHWCIVNRDSNAQIFVAWRQDAAYFFVRGLGGSLDCDGFTASLSALRLAFETIPVPAPEELSHPNISEVDALDCNGNWYQSFVVEGSTESSEKIRIHFMGWDSKWDETISRSDFGSRIRPRSSCDVGPNGPETLESVCQAYRRRIAQFPGASSVVEVDALDRGGNWYQSFVVEGSTESSEKIRIHFMGWDSKWDETISRSDFGSRIRPRSSCDVGPNGPETLESVCQAYRRRFAQTAGAHCTELAAPFIEVITTCRVDWPGPGHDIGNRLREESTSDVVLVALAHNEVSSQIMSNPNPLQWGRAAACTTFELGSMKQSSPSPWTCTKGHALWPVFLMPDERYTGGWACDVCDSHLQFFCSAPVLHCEICKFDVCGQCQMKHSPMQALEVVAAQNEAGWDDVDEDEDIFDESGDDDDDDAAAAGHDDDDQHELSTEPLSSSEIEGSDEEVSAGGDEESSDNSDDDGHSGDGSQGTYSRVSHIFVDASFNELGTSVRRALHAAPMFSRCVRAFHLSSVSRPPVVALAQPAISDVAAGARASSAAL